MYFIKYLFFLYLSFFLSINAQAFLDKDNKGAQSDGREDLSFLNTDNSNFKKGMDAIKRAKKYLKKDKKQKANKRFNKAIEYLVLAYKETPDNPEILSNLGFAYLSVNDLIMAEIYFEEGLILNPKHNSINEQLGKLYFKTNRISLSYEKLEVLKACNCDEYTRLKNIIDRN
jgi:tetratricopeptide (TPR) repeat protein